MNLGVEKHFKGSERLSTFMGADLLIGTTKDYRETSTNTPTATGTNTFSNIIKNNNGSTFFGLGLVSGADYYIAKKVYLGIEIGLQMLTASEKNRVQTIENNIAGVITSTETTNSPDNSAFLFISQINGGIKIGYQF